MKLGKSKAEQISEGKEETSKKSLQVGKFVKRHKKLTIFVCVVVIGAVVTVTVLGRKPKEPQITGSGYTTTTLEKRDISTSISVTGTIASAESKTVTTTLSNIDVKNLNVQVGDVVTKGDTLVVFDDSALSEDLADAKSSLSVSQAQTANNLQSAERSYQEASENASVQASRAADNVTSSYNSYTQAVSTEASTKTAYQTAKSQEEDAQKAYQQQGETVDKLQQEVEQLTTDLQNAAEDEKDSIQKKLTKKQQSLETAQKKYEELATTYKEAQQSTTTAQQAYEQAAASLEQASSSYTKAVQDQEDTERNNKSTLANQESSLENTKLQSTNGSKNEEDQVETLQEQIDGCTITAPISGVVTALNVEEGETFAGGEVLTIQDNTNFIVEASVDEYDIADIEKGMSVVIKTDATGEEELQGEVTYVAPTASSSSGSSSEMTGASSTGSSGYEVKISIHTTNDRLRIGMSAKVSILTASREDVFAVPYDAIETNENGESVIYVVDTPMSEQKKAIVVEAGLESDYYTEISSDELTEGMLVVTGSSGKSENSTPDNDMGMMFDGMGGGKSGGGGGNPGGMGQRP